MGPRKRSRAAGSGSDAGATPSARAGRIRRGVLRGSGARRSCCSRRHRGVRQSLRAPSFVTRTRIAHGPSSGSRSRCSATTGVPRGALPRRSLALRRVLRTRTTSAIFSTRGSIGPPKPCPGSRERFERDPRTRRSRHPTRTRSFGLDAKTEARRVLERALGPDSETAASLLGRWATKPGDSVAP